MEHRWNIRHPVVVDVLIHHKEITKIHCKTRNVGREGMFVETDSMTCQPHTMLQVEFELCSAGITKKHSLPALVVHSSSNGLGLLFMQNTYDLFCVNNFITQDPVDTVKTNVESSDKNHARLTG